MLQCVCEQCGTSFESRRGARHCGATCRQRAHRATSPAAGVVQLQPPAAPPVGAHRGLAESCRARLKAAGREDDVLGVQALLLAELLLAGGHTASGIASVSRELRATMDAALAGAAAEPDALDDLAARRARKLGGA